MRTIETQPGTFGHRLSVSMDHKHYNTPRLSKETGISTTSLNNYKKNKFMPNTVELKQICEKLDVSSDYLIWGKE